MLDRLQEISTREFKIAFVQAPEGVVSEAEAPAIVVHCVVFLGPFESLSLYFGTDLVIKQSCQTPEISQEISRNFHPIYCSRLLFEVNVESVREKLDKFVSFLQPHDRHGEGDYFFVSLLDYGVGLVSFEQVLQLFSDIGFHSCHCLPGGLFIDLLC